MKSKTRKTFPHDRLSSLSRLTFDCAVVVAEPEELKNELFGTFHTLSTQPDANLCLWNKCFSKLFEANIL